MDLSRLNVTNAQLEAFCRARRISRLAVFGSVLRDDFGPDSDIDMLVDFEAGFNPGLSFFGIQHELAALLGRHVDLLTFRSVHPYLRGEIYAEATDLYGAA
jgi:predicted nucleotidyltransferase